MVNVRPFIDRNRTFLPSLFRWCLLIIRASRRRIVGRTRTLRSILHLELQWKQDISGARSEGFALLQVLKMLRTDELLEENLDLGADLATLRHIIGHNRPRVFDDDEVVWIGTDRHGDARQRLVLETLETHDADEIVEMACNCNVRSVDAQAVTSFLQRW